jgi:hypothetical protein
MNNISLISGEDRSENSQNDDMNRRLKEMKKKLRLQLDENDEISMIQGTEGRGEDSDIDLSRQGVFLKNMV